MTHNGVLYRKGWYTILFSYVNHNISLLASPRHTPAIPRYNQYDYTENHKVYNKVLFMEYVFCYQAIHNNGICYCLPHILVHTHADDITTIVLLSILSPCAILPLDYSLHSILFLDQPKHSIILGIVCFHRSRDIGILNHPSSETPKL